jgi:uncharacterized protein (TIGR01777 family)
MKIIIAGGSGLVGSKLIPKLLAKGHEVINLTTNKNARSSNGVSQSFWNPSEGLISLVQFENADAVVNLAGFNVANRWTSANKKAMIESRLQSTNLLVNTMASLSSGPKTFVSASAVGIYSSSLESQDENALSAKGFLADLTQQWEDASAALPASVRRIVLRIGVVLDQQEGALAKMLPIYKLGLGSATGSGQQMMSWIHAEDLANAFLFALETPEVKGIYNAVAPHPVSNKVFSKALAHQLGKPHFLPTVPGFALRLLFGEMATMLLNSQNISCAKLQDAGFKFEFENLDKALANILPKTA